LPSYEALTSVGALFASCLSQEGEEGQQTESGHQSEHTGNVTIEEVLNRQKSSIVK